MIEPVRTAPQRPEAVTPRPNARLLEALQMQAQSSVLLAGLAGPDQSLFRVLSLSAAAPPIETQLLGSFRAGRETQAFLSSVAPFSQHEAMSRETISGNALTAMRSAQQVLQIFGMATPSAADGRSGSGAYLMEMQAQRGYQSMLIAGMSGVREWFA
jgi:hypothetical protein